MTFVDERMDIELVQACRQGDETAWDTLVARYERLVFTIPLRYGLPRSEAEDVFQAVWLTLLKHINSLEQPERLSAWLVTTAKRECWSRRRGADYERLQIVDPEKLPEPGQAIEDATPEEIVSKFENESKLRAAMRELGDRCRQLLWYLYDAPSKPSYDEIAERLSMPKGAIGPNRARCLKQLRGMLRGK